MSAVNHGGGAVSHASDTGLPSSLAYCLAHLRALLAIAHCITLCGLVAAPWLTWLAVLQATLTPRPGWQAACTSCLASLPWCASHGRLATGEQEVSRHMRWDTCPHGLVLLLALRLVVTRWQQPMLQQS